MSRPEQYGDLRVIDLVAKAARTSLRDTERLLRALDKVMLDLDVDLDKVMEPIDKHDKVPPPSPENRAACSHAFEDLFKTCN